MMLAYTHPAGLKEEDSNPEEDAVNNEALQTSSHDLKDTAIWRLLDGPGATPEVAARTPVANRNAAGRLDFVLQVLPPPISVSLRIWLLYPACVAETGYLTPTSRGGGPS